MALDERLERELDRAARPADPSGVYEDLIRRRERLRLRRRVSAGAIAFVVFVGGAVGLFALSRTIGDDHPSPAEPGALEGRLIFVARDPSRAIDGVSFGWGIASMNPDGTDVRDLQPPGFDETLYPTASPDGSEIAFAGFVNEPRSRGIYVMDADGSNVRQILPTGEQLTVLQLSWSPDGSRIGVVFMVNVPSHNDPTDVSDERTIWTMAPDGSDLRQVTTVGREQAMAWSPNGNKIAFARTEPVDPNVQDTPEDLYVVNVDGSNEMRITTTGDVFGGVAWAPDRSGIVYAGAPPSGEGLDLYEVADDGTGRHRLTTDPGNEFEPVWSPDGALLLYNAAPLDAGDDTPCRVMTVHTDGSGARQLTEGETCPGSYGLWWSPSPPGTTERPTGSTVTGTSSRDVASTLPAVGSVCGVTSIRGRFLSAGAETTAYVFEPEPEGGCDGSNENFQYIGIADASGDVTAISPKLRDCQAGLGCWAFAAPDLDHDGFDELALGVGTNGGSIQFELYAMTASPRPLVPGDCDRCSRVFSWGRPGDHAEGAYCLENVPAGDFVAWNAEAIDTGDAYGVVETTYDVKGSFFTKVDSAQTRVPLDDSAIPPGGGNDFCGSAVAAAPITAGRSG